MAVEAESLMLFSLGKPLTDRAWLRSNADLLLSAPAVALFEDLTQRRLLDEPIAYITGVQEFYGLPIRIDSRVLVPRPDTETLVDWALDLLSNSHAPRVADMGTGSGAIALAIKYKRPDAFVVATDVSTDALTLAQWNAKQLGLRINFLCGDWAEPLTTFVGLEHSCFQVLLANPPYIADGDPHLCALKHEPAMALTSGPDGLKDIRQIIHVSPQHLCGGGWLILEHGHDQAPAVRNLMVEKGFVKVQSRKDLPGIERCTGGQWPSPNDER